MPKLVWTSTGVGNCGELTVSSVGSDSIDENVLEFRVHQQDGYRTGEGKTLWMSMDTHQAAGLIDALKNSLDHNRKMREEKKATLEEALHRLR